MEVFFTHIMGHLWLTERWRSQVCHHNETQNEIMMRFTGKALKLIFPTRQTKYGLECGTVC